jgi:ABC-type multidrug transport system fused ATPase/permease subunit
VTVVIGFLLISAVTFSQNNAARSVAIISVFLAASTRIAPAILRIQQVSISIKSASSSAIPTITLIESLKSKNIVKEVVNKFTNIHEGFSPQVSLNNIYFTYEGNDKETLKDINLEVKPGQIVAIVGKSGSGKTTLVDVITGVLTPNAGQVTISKIKSADVSRQFPGAISYVPQDVFISNGTIRSNICLGFEINEISDEEIWQALETAQLFDVVNQLPSKLDNPIGDRGSKLSGGQRQRLGIARALITKPRLLILDEATSSLDSQTELDVSESILNLVGDVTVIIIAHRLSTVQKSDIVVYIDNGEIKSCGPFSKVRNEIPDFDLQAKLLGI